MQIPVNLSMFQLKNQRSGSKTVCIWLFYYFNFERNYDVLKSKSPCFLLKNINFNKNETELKIENPTHTFRETGLVLPLIQESWIKVKQWWVGAHKRKRESMSFISMYSVLNTHSIYIYFLIWKNITSYTFLLVFKILESLQCILKAITWITKEMF